MPELHPTDPAAAGVPPGVFVAAEDDFDFALGCECADPALQIERWAHEAALPSRELS